MLRWDSRTHFIRNEVSFYLEESSISPAVVPGIGTEVVRNTCIDTVAEHLDGMPTNVIANNMLVNSWFIVQKIFIHLEWSLYWTIDNQIC